MLGVGYYLFPLNKDSLVNVSANLDPDQDFLELEARVKVRPVSPESDLSKEIDDSSQSANT